MNNQHMNGGLAVDTWGQTSLPGCYAIGEAAGTHGVTRPGGAALNAGQVFGTRCSEHIAARNDRAGLGVAPDALVSTALEAVDAVLRSDSPLRIDTVRHDIQARMSDHAGMVCRAADVRSALGQAQALNAAIRQQGISPGDKAFDAVHALQWRHNALASEAILAALDFYIGRGGGSRGARAVCSPEGNQLPATRLGPLEEFRFVPERVQDRAEQITVRLQADRFALQTRLLRPRARGERPFFERNWPDYLTGRIYGDAQA